MDLHLDVPVTGEVTASLYRQLVSAIRDGRLTAGARLPSSRDLALSLGLSRGTIATVYERLTAESLVETRRGSGTYVAATVLPRSVRSAPHGRRVAPRPVWNSLPRCYPDGPPLPYDLSVGGPDPGLFPLATWRRLTSETLRPSVIGASPYSDGGHPALQAAIAGYLGRSRSVVCSRSDVVLTNGAQQGFDLVARVLVAPGDVVAVEDPAYTGAVRLFARHGARVVGVPVDEEGLVVEALPDQAKVVYVTPSHQFPTGVVMSLRRRCALLEWAARRGAVVLEDDYDSEFRHENRPLEPLQSLDPDGCVVYAGSFSKILSPMLRVGYLVAPRSLQAALRTAKTVTDWQGDLVTATTLARFIADGELASQLRRTSRAYADRRRALLAALAEVPGLDVVPSAAGLRIAAWFRDSSVDDVAVVEAAARAGVGVEPLSVRFVTEPPRPGLAFGVGRIEVSQVPEAVARIASAAGSVGQASA